MILMELLEITNENTEVVLYNEHADEISSYDGKNSIEEEYNYCEVTDMYVWEGKLCIYIDTSEMEEDEDDC